MKFTERYAELFNRLLPSPFTIAVLLTALTFILAFFFTGGDKNPGTHFIDLVGYWENGLWDRGLMVFAFQMMLMLILGHALALTKPVSTLINYTLQFCTTTARAAFLVTFFTILVALFNWGLGLIFGAIFARKVAEYAHRVNMPLNYPLIGAAVYSGLMVWHGGVSGSSLVKAAEPNHIREMMSGIYSPNEVALLPGAIGFDQTVFSGMNLSVMLVLILVLPASMYYLGKSVQTRSFSIHFRQWHFTENEMEIKGADKLNHSAVMAWLFAGFVFIGVLVRIYSSGDITSFRFMTPDFINLTLLFLCLVFHGSFHRFVHAVDDAISGAAGILIQFPLYFGIMGLMKNSGMVEDLSTFFTSMSNEFTFPIFTYISAGIINIFVPSGGGQWAVQGPIIIQTADAMGIPISKCIMALAYGDQLTNMLQPFWALPLLGITGLKAKEILPYTLYLMGLGFVIYLAALMLF